MKKISFLALVVIVVLALLAIMFSKVWPNNETDLPSELKKREEYSQSWMGRYRQIELLPSCVKNFSQGACDGRLLSGVKLTKFYKPRLSATVHCSKEELEMYDDWYATTKKFIEEAKFQSYITKLSDELRDCLFVGDDTYFTICWEGQLVGTADSNVYDAKKRNSPHTWIKLHDIDGKYALDFVNFPHASIKDVYRELPNFIRRSMTDYTNATGNVPNFPEGFLEGIVLSPEAEEYYRKEERDLK